MLYLGMTNDGQYAFSDRENIFIKHYEKKWLEILHDSYYHTELLNYGHKLRPRLVYWGYCIGKPSTSLTEDDYDAIAQVAVSIELVHKASILLDDYIDGDTARHGITAFHITYGPECTMIFSLNILCRALRIINDVFINYISEESYSKLSIKLVVQTLEDMTLGVLKELDLSNNLSMHNIDNVKEIMYLETSTLITNSLLIGYLLSQETNASTIGLIQKIGYNLGYIFQTLNDLEPFCSQKNNDHKGSLNTDVSRKRKNICLPLLNKIITLEEKQKLNNSNMVDMDIFLLELFQKYDIKLILFDEIKSASAQIHKYINQMSADSKLKIWCDDFHSFVDSIILVSKNRLE